MKNMFLHNWGLKLVSLLMAFFLWCVIARFGDPPDTRSFSDIKVRFVNTSVLEDQGKVYEVLGETDTVRVTISASKSVIDSLRNTDIVAEADLSKLTGQNTVPIHYDVLNANLGTGTIEGDHDEVQLNVEDRAEKWVRVTYSLIGDVATGYTVVSASPELNRIEISGPASLLNQVSYAYVELDVTGATNSISANVEVGLYDKDNKKLEYANLTKTVRYIMMKVDVLPTKEVPIEIQVTGTPRDGYLATGEVTQSLTSVRVAGSATQLSNMNKLVISGDALDLTDRTESIETSLSLNNYLPSGIRLVDTDSGNRITVKVKVEEILTRIVTIPASEIVLLNVPEGMDAKVDDGGEGYQLEVSGLARYLDNLDADNGKIAGMVDIGKWIAEKGMEKLRPGTYSIPIQFTELDGVTQKNRLEAKVIVKKAS